ncbi:hypothetical protein BDW22DRAFT_1346334 [Trametopsis cervina]|nr:hypothetical protein BDW22DRAFT_1346334 [Trametopsis cervina]
MIGGVMGVSDVGDTKEIVCEDDEREVNRGSAARMMYALGSALHTKAFSKKMGPKRGGTSEKAAAKAAKARTVAAKTDDAVKSGSARKTVSEKMTEALNRAEEAFTTYVVHDMLASSPMHVFGKINDRPLDPKFVTELADSFFIYGVDRFNPMHAIPVAMNLEGIDRERCTREIGEDPQNLPKFLTLFEDIPDRIEPLGGQHRYHAIEKAVSSAKKAQGQRRQKVARAMADVEDAEEALKNNMVAGATRTLEEQLHARKQEVLTTTAEMQQGDKIVKGSGVWLYKIYDISKMGPAEAQALASNRRLVAKGETGDETALGVYRELTEADKLDGWRSDDVQKRRERAEAATAWSKVLQAKLADGSVKKATGLIKLLRATYATRLMQRMMVYRGYYAGVEAMQLRNLGWLTDVYGYMFTHGANIMIGHVDAMVRKTEPRTLADVKAQVSVALKTDPKKPAMADKAQAAAKDLKDWLRGPEGVDRELHGAMNTELFQVCNQVYADILRPHGRDIGMDTKSWKTAYFRYVRTLSENVDEAVRRRLSVDNEMDEEMKDVLRGMAARLYVSLMLVDKDQPRLPVLTADPWVHLEEMLKMNTVAIREHERMLSGVEGEMPDSMNACYRALRGKCPIAWTYAIGRYIMRDCHIDWFACISQYRIVISRSSTSDLSALMADTFTAPGNIISDGKHYQASNHVFGYILSHAHMVLAPLTAALSPAPVGNCTVPPRIVEKAEMDLLINDMFWNSNEQLSPTQHWEQIVRLNKLATKREKDKQDDKDSENAKKQGSSRAKKQTGKGKDKPDDDDDGEDATEEPKKDDDTPTFLDVAPYQQVLDLVPKGTSFREFREKTYKSVYTDINKACNGAQKTGTMDTFLKNVVAVFIIREGIQWQTVKQKGLASIITPLFNAACYEYFVASSYRPQLIDHGVGGTIRNDLDAILTRYTESGRFEKAYIWPDASLLAKPKDRRPAPVPERSMSDWWSDLSIGAMITASQKEMQNIVSRVESSYLAQSIVDETAALNRSSTRGSICSEVHFTVDMLTASLSTNFDRNLYYAWKGKEDGFDPQAESHLPKAMKRRPVQDDNFTIDVLDYSGILRSYKAHITERAAARELDKSPDGEGPSGSGKGDDAGDDMHMEKREKAEHELPEGDREEEQEEEQEDEDAEEQVRRKGKVSRSAKEKAKRRIKGKGKGKGRMDESETEDEEEEEEEEEEEGDEVAKEGRSDDDDEEENPKSEADEAEGHTGSEGGEGTERDRGADKDGEDDPMGTDDEKQGSENASANGSRGSDDLARKLSILDDEFSSDDGGPDVPDKAPSSDDDEELADAPHVTQPEAIAAEHDGMSDGEAQQEQGETVLDVPVAGATEDVDMADPGTADTGPDITAGAAAVGDPDDVDVDVVRKRARGESTASSAKSVGEKSPPKKVARTTTTRTFDASQDSFSAKIASMTRFAEASLTEVEDADDTQSPQRQVSQGQVEEADLQDMAISDDEGPPPAQQPRHPSVESTIETQPIVTQERLEDVFPGIGDTQPPFTPPANIPVTSALTASQDQEIDTLFPSPTQQSQSLPPSPQRAPSLQRAPSRQRAPSQQPSTQSSRGRYTLRSRTHPPPPVPSRRNADNIKDPEHVPRNPDDTLDPRMVG